MHTDSCEQRRFCPGFTLLEIMVSVAVISIVLVSVYKLHAQTIDMHRSARFYTTASLLAQQKMAELETLPIEDLADGSGDFGEDLPEYRWAASFEDVDSEPLGSIAKNLKKISVTVSLRKDRLTYNLTSYRYFSD